VVVGDARSAFYNCAERGVLAQFRHQHFLLFLIAHFQKSALLMLSDRLAEALKHLDVSDPDSIRRFKRDIRESFTGFLGFTHRYWFHEVSEQAQARALFRMCTAHLGTDALYAEVKERIADMSGYLEADSLRRQANTVVRLTVVTIFGLIGTVTTGFLGMNLLAEADAPLAYRLALFAAVFVGATALTIYTMAKSKRLSDFLDALSDERMGASNKAKAFIGVWRRGGED
jgi:Mg2+ and Co2+ transporter CorA